MTTYQEKLEVGLQLMGWSRDMTDRSHYKAYKHPESKTKLFVGAAGALRCGECASRSFSIGDPTRQTPRYKAILAAGESAIKPSKSQAFAEF